jgi:zinc protease
MEIRRTARGALRRAALALGAGAARVLVARALVALALVVPAAAPAAAQDAGIPRLAYEKYTLPNGLEVILHEDRSVPLVAVNTWYKVGSGDEKVGRTGFAHLFEHILFMGSQHVPVGAFDQWLEAAGAGNNGSTWFDRTNYYEWMPSNALPLALWLDADRMGWLLPTMDKAKLDLQRDVVKNERRESVDNAPYGKAYETILAALYPKGHPYSWSTIGSMADLSAASVEDVNDFFRTYYAPNNATLVVAGDFDRDSAKVWIQRYFGGIPRGPAMPARPAPAPFAVRDTFLVVEDKVQLPRLYNAWHAAKNYTADDAALSVLATVLANDKNSRLYKRLVYDMQVAQDVGAEQEGYKLDGHFTVVVTPKPGEQPQRMQQLIDEEIARVVKDGITPRELERAQNTVRARFLDQLASVRNKADLLNSYNYLVGEPDWAREDAARFDKVTAEDVRRVAEQYLQKAGRVTLTVVPEGKTSMMVNRAAGGTP